MKVYQDKVALVTGAASGIGRALVQELALNGARVAATDVNQEMLDRAVKGAVPGRHPVITERLDVTDYETFEAIINDTVRREGRIDYIFNNAGIAVGGEVRDQELEHWQKVLNVNLFGVIHGSMLAYKIMARQGYGHIVNIASIEGMIPFPATVPYVTSKFGIMGLSQGMWVEGADLGVKVSVACPGYVKTAIMDASEVVGADRQELLKSLDKLEKFSISPERCARLILKGAAKNKPIIPITGLVRFIWLLARFSPTLVMKLIRRDFAGIRHKTRLLAPAPAADTNGQWENVTGEESSGPAGG